MGAQENLSLEDRMRAMEDRWAIAQLVCGYGYAMDGCNEEAVASLYSEDGIYAVEDMSYDGRERIGKITKDANHLARVKAGCAHVSTLPYIVLDGDRAVATCYTMVVQKNQKDPPWVVDRLSASRLQVSRKPDGGWQIDHRQNYLQTGAARGPALLARLMEGPGPG